MRSTVWETHGGLHNNEVKWPVEGIFFVFTQAAGRLLSRWDKPTLSKHTTSVCLHFHSHKDKTPAVRRNPWSVDFWEKSKELFKKRRCNGLLCNCCIYTGPVVECNCISTFLFTLHLTSILQHFNSVIPFCFSVYSIFQYLRCDPFTSKLRLKAQNTPWTGHQSITGLRYTIHSNLEAI